MIAALMGSALVPTLIRFSQASTASDAMVRARVSARIEQMHTIDFIAQDIQRASGYETSVQIGRPPTAQPVMPVAAGCVPPVVLQLFLFCSAAQAIKTITSSTTATPVSMPVQVRLLAPVVGQIQRVCSDAVELLNAQAHHKPALLARTS